LSDLNLIGSGRNVNGSGSNLIRSDRDRA
jgi:hypothetical protein